MEHRVRKQVLIGVVVVCFVLAGAITVITSSSRRRGGGRTSREKIWVMCRNPKCGAEHQIEYDDYFQYIVQHRDRFSDVEPPMTCEKCGEPSVYEAIKCAKCGLLFEPGSVPNDVEDKCPKCGYSTLQEQRELRKAEGAGK
ncbi:MAG: hypothetical protein ACYST6_06460 [Planctomycetota bacterium]|jgi:DNA-directed RNA polymerase subunit RPC12/RpoP